MTRPEWEGPINREANFTGLVRKSSGDAIIESNLEGLAAIASGLFAVADAVQRAASAACGCNQCDAAVHD